MRKALYLMLAVSFPACSDSTVTPPQFRSAPSNEEMAACATADYDDPVIEGYWAAGTFEEEVDEFVTAWYSQQLCAMGEAPLAAPPRGQVRIRFLWLRSFHPGIAVRIEHKTGDTQLVATELAGAGGYEAGLVAQQVENSLSPEQWGNIQAKLMESQFWRLPTIKKRDFISTDGAQWVLEVAEYDRYHLIDHRGGEEVDLLGRYLLQLSELEPDPIY